MPKVFSRARAGALTERLRVHAGAMLVDGFFRGVSRAGRLHPAAKPERHNVEVLRDIPYRGTDLVEHRLDIYRPTKLRPPLPVVLYAHGGGFRILSKDSHWLMGLIFARRGYLCFNISYRLAPRHRFPCAIEDTCAAFEWLVENAPRYGGDLSRVVLAGESAGANLITALAVAIAYERKEAFARRVFARGVVPRAVVPACGIHQVSNPDRFRRNTKNRRLFSRFLQDRFAEIADAYLGGVEPDGPGFLDLADPLLFLERGDKPQRPLPPFFAPVGRWDPLMDDTLRLKAALDAIGVRCEAPLYKGHHAFHAFVMAREARRCWADTFEFLGRALAA
jgi:acetyl esterase/lipase